MLGVLPLGDFATPTQPQVDDIDTASDGATHFLHQVVELGAEPKYCRHLNNDKKCTMCHPGPAEIIVTEPKPFHDPAGSDTFTDFLCPSVSESDTTSSVISFDLLQLKLKTLLKFYKMQMPSTTPPGAGVVFSGGLQQYLIRQSRLCKEYHTQTKKQEVLDGTTGFHNLPDSLHLHIFSFLPARDLCQIASVCKHWWELSTDDILWRERLAEDIRTWNTISHVTNPHMYTKCQSDWSYKEIYLRCSPEVAMKLQVQNMTFQQLSGFLRSLWPRKTPKLAMLGPGLESNTSRIVRKVLHNQSGLFKATGMFPGQYEGMGSGFSLRMASGMDLKLTTLYTTTAAQRQSQQQDQRLLNNRMFAAQAPANVEKKQPEFELRQAVKDLCHSLDGLIFVVDATKSNPAVECGKQELFAITNELWDVPTLPVLIMSCVQEGNVTRIPATDIVEILDLGSLTRPWQVHDVVVDCEEGIESSFHWIVQQSQRH